MPRDCNARDEVHLSPYARHTPLAALPAVALDLETTGLVPARDRIVQMAAITMQGASILDAPRLDRVIDPGIPIPGTATKIHGLGDADVAGAPAFGALRRELRELLSGRVVIGHNIGFDLAVLSHEAARAGLEWSAPPFLDVGLLAGALHPALAEPSLEAVAQWLDVTIEGRHSALGDAMAAARVYARLIPRLRAADVRTLAGAQLLMSRRADLVLRQARAGWHVDAADEPAVLPGASAPRIDSYVFERRVADVMSAPALTVAAGVTLREAAQLMAGKRIGALLVGGAGAPPAGILTERDVLRATGQAAIDPALATVGEIMSAPVELIGAEEMLYRALGRMDRKGIRHLCVVDAAGVPVGMISQRDLLRHRARSLQVIEDAIATAETTPALAAAYGRMPDTAARLLAESVSAIALSQVISSELRALTARAAQIAVSRLAAGHGPAPAPWCFLVLGSGGRGESLLSADQDNAIVHAGAARDDAWFAALGAMVSELLDEAGVPRCKGGVMAANPQWRGNLAQWYGRVDEWLHRASPQDLLHVDIFFDLAPVAGDAGLARTLHASAVAAASRAPPFIALLAESVAGLAPPRTVLGRVRTEAGRLDLKLCGLLPLVSIARTLALRVGSGARSTPDRLREAATAGRLPESDLASLLEIHADLTALVVHQQLDDLAHGIPPSGRVALARLDPPTIKRVRRELDVVDGILGTLRRAVSG